ncbi:hypothetical protein GCM10009092_33830 [Bowmanella denitrificans]|uniref:Uncharacterized protein n=1 Tax=Bowmanella denitrificans TaxID=366582 RepID=A0ABN0XKR9_9ALTE
MHYQGVIRDGDFGRWTQAEQQVVRCDGCGLVRLSDNPNSPDYYQSEEYRQAYNGSAVHQDYIRMHDGEQPPRLEHVGIGHFRDKQVLDFGAGGGAFLDHIKGVAKQTYAIEPFIGYHQALSARGHQVFSDAHIAKGQVAEQIDTLVSFGVIEHVDDPLQFLCDAYDLLRPGGKMFLETDNLNDVLLQLGIPAFEPFFYRTAHLWYFDQASLVRLAQKAGFADIKVSFRHNFDLSNALMWARDGKPTGNAKLPLLDERINSAWQDFVIGAGLADLICVQMVKG